MEQSKGSAHKGSAHKPSLPCFTGCSSKVISSDCARQICTRGKNKKYKPKVNLILFLRTALLFFSCLGLCIIYCYNLHCKAKKVKHVLVNGTLSSTFSSLLLYLPLSPINVGIPNHIFHCISWKELWGTKKKIKTFTPQGNFLCRIAKS